MPSKTDYPIVVQSLTKMYDKRPCVSDVNLEVLPGEILGFIGPNGAGKTTTIRMLVGEIRPSSGQAYLFGHPAMADAALIHRRVGYLTGDMAMDRDLTGRQYLNYVGHLRGGLGLDRIQALAKRFNADLSKKIGTLSRGNIQKIGLIAAVMHEPELLILDEPSSGFDPLIQAEFGKLILEHKAAGRTAFISSHVLSEVQHLCDRVALIREGEIVKVETMSRIAKDLYKQVRLDVSGRPSLKALEDMAGVRNIARTDGRITFEYGGSSQSLLAALVSYDIDDFSVTDADLETLFMHYYREA